MQPAVSAVEFFISYNHRDTAWAEWVAWQLEANGYPTIIQAWDFGAGSNFVLDMDRALKQARKMILVLSRNYLESSFTSPEWAAAFAADPTGQEARVIPVRIEDVALKGLLAQIVYVDLVGKDESAAREALLAHVNAVRGKPSRAPRFPGDTPPPEFPGARTQERASGSLPATEPARADITVEWPRGPLYSESTYPVHMALPPGVGCVRIKLEYTQQLLWVSGPGKVPDSSEFVCEFNGRDTAHTVELKLGVRSVPGECIEPITAYFFGRDERQIAESSGDLELVPRPAPPSVVRSVLQTALWLIGAEPGKPLLIRALHMAARLALLATVALGYHYYKTPDPVTRLKIDLKLVPGRYVVKPHQVNYADETQEFFLNRAAAVLQGWSCPPAWTIEPGFMSDVDPKDGKLRLIGPGVGTFPINDGYALYNFHLAFAVELPPQGVAGWIIRAQPHSPSVDPDSVPGYHFTLTNRGTDVYLSAKAIGVATRVFGKTAYSLLKGEVNDMFVELRAHCCSPQDRIRVQIEASGFDLNHGFHLQHFGPGPDDSTEYAPVIIDISDRRQAFRYGQFQIFRTFLGPGPAYEFVRLQEAS